MSSNILVLPTEILAYILCQLSYTDLLAFSATCRETQAFASPRNQQLWQAIFLQKFDDPRDRWNTLPKTTRLAIKEREEGWDWYTELQRRVQALRYIKAGALPIDEDDTEKSEEVISALLDIIDTAKSCPTPEEARQGIKVQEDDRYLSKNIGLLPINYHFTPEFDGLIRGLPASVIRRNVNANYYGGDILAAASMPGSWDPAPGRPLTRSQAALSETIAYDKIVRSENASRLHVLCGLTSFEEQDEKAIGRARRIVYDWNSTDESNEWGPYKRDGSGAVDWRRLEAVCTVAARQFAMAVRGRIVMPQSFCFSVPHRTLSDPTVPEDWARVQGVWCGTYVFLHWEDLVEFNQTASPSERPTLERSPEACGGFMKMELKLNMDLQGDQMLQPKSPICNDLPILYFSGISRSADFQMATGVRGSVCLAAGGREVRWRYIVYYSGSDQWLLEGVQPGGPRSAAVYGLWTSVQHERGGPVGPVCYCPEELCKPTSVVLVS